MPYRRLGSTDRLSTTVRDSTGALADPTDIFLDLLDPAGIETTLDYNPGPIVRDGTGLFHYDVGGLSTLGRYGWLYRTTGNVQGVGDPKYFTLVSKWTPILITLAEAKSFTNTTAPDPDLELYVDSATETLEKWVGPIVPQVVTRRAVVGMDGELLLPTYVVSGSITAATQDGASISVSGWTVDDAVRGVVYPTVTPPRWSKVLVTYTGGLNPIPAPLKESSGLVVQASYEIQRGPAGMPLGDEQDAGFGSSYPLMLRARDKAEPYMAPSVA